MNVVYRTQLTEVEHGMERPDGVAYSFQKERLETVSVRQRSRYHEAVIRSSPGRMCLVDPELSRKIHESGGVYTTTQEEDPGMLGFFIPGNTRANLELYKRRSAEAMLAMQE